MSKNKQKEVDKEALLEEQLANESGVKANEVNTETQEDATVNDYVQQLESKVAELETKVSDLEDIRLRQMAEFDNYRRRTNKEKLDLMNTAGESIFKEMLPLVDDFERALKSMNDSSVDTDNIVGFREGVELIYKKFIAFLEKNGVKAIDTDEADFDTDLHEAVTTFAAGDDKKGKIIDCTQKGYTLGDKVIRFAKVVVGE